MCLLEIVSFFGNYTIMSFLRQAARILANLIVMGSTILARAVVQAYRQALTNASKNGVAQEAVQNIKRASKTMTEAEARQILGVTENSSWEEIVQVHLNVCRSNTFFVFNMTLTRCFSFFLQKYDNLFERNAQNGSFYLQSKVHRAKECLEAVHKPKEPETK
ncbi:hypothetical protein T459_01277 [Capsicum annuum]|uniref:Uncharacterized protein n=1 Tax=Capsicum annuum TaxID=4072 RepID=A0A2G3AGM7_CAPAN|nr:hypothetical protein T459_01277 [Capsicum annuum]